MKYLSIQYFKDDEGAWHPPGSLIELEHETAALYKSRGYVIAYQTQAVSAPETRVFDMRRKTRKGGAR